MYCTKCGTEYEGNFCPYCGTPTPVIKTNMDFGKQDVSVPQYDYKSPKRRISIFPIIAIIVIILIAAGLFCLTNNKRKKEQTETISVAKAEDNSTSAQKTESKPVTKIEENSTSFSSSLNDSNSSIISFYDMSFRIPNRFGEKASNSRDDVYYFYDTSFDDDQLMMLSLMYSEIDITEEEYETAKDTFADSFQNGVENSFSNVKNKKKQKIEMAGVYCRIKM